MSSKIITIESSLDDFEKIRKIIVGSNPDIFYHLAWAGVNGPEKGNIFCQITNIQTTIKCAEFAKSINVKKFLCAGTIAERNVDSLGNVKQTGPSMFYGCSKHSAHLLLETYCKNIGLDFVWMQFSNIYGLDNKTGNLISYTIGKLRNNEQAMFGPAREPYDFLFDCDLIEAVFRLGTMKTYHSFYYIGSGEPRRLSEYLLVIGEIFNKKDLIKIGAREDDGIRYSFDMFDATETFNDIGNYITCSFEEHLNKFLKA